MVIYYLLSDAVTDAAAAVCLRRFVRRAPENLQRMEAARTDIEVFLPSVAKYVQVIF